MAVTVLLRKKALQKAITFSRVIGFIILFSGLALKILEVPGSTVALITGAVLILLARIVAFSSKA